MVTEKKRTKKERWKEKEERKCRKRDERIEEGKKEKK